jgi:glycine betaine/choline ABC-type transport system substrate-binding protein
LSDLANKIAAEDMRHLNAEVDANQRDAATVARAFRATKSL